MKNYYEILGLTHGATETEIKYVFRKLAITYHPDKNPSPDAEAIFKEVNEAYEVLGDPVKRKYYDQLLLNGVSAVVIEKKNEPWRKDPVYSKRRDAGYTPPPQGPSARRIMMESFLKYLRFLSWGGIIWSSFLLFDYISSPVLIEETVITDIKTMRKVGIRRTTDLLFTDKGHHFPLHFGEVDYFPAGSKLRLYKSSMFSLLIKLENEKQTYEVNNLATIYRNFSFAPVLLAGLCIVGAFWREGREFRFNIGVVMILIFFFNMFLFFASRI